MTVSEPKRRYRVIKNGNKGWAVEWPIYSGFSGEPTGEWCIRKEFRRRWKAVAWASGQAAKEHDTRVSEERANAEAVTAYEAAEEEAVYFDV